MVKNNNAHKYPNDNFYPYYLSKIFSWADIIPCIRISTQNNFIYTNRKHTTIIILPL